MSPCSYRNEVEFGVRRIWCAAPWADIDTVAGLMKMTVPTLCDTLNYIDDLSAKTIIEYGKKRLRETGSTNARLIGFPRDGRWDEF
jgi:hypothetical protein